MTELKIMTCSTTTARHYAVYELHPASLLHPRHSYEFHAHLTVSSNWVIVNWYTYTYFQLLIIKFENSHSKTLKVRGKTIIAHLPRAHVLSPLVNETNHHDEQRAGDHHRYQQQNQGAGQGSS